MHEFERDVVLKSARQQGWSEHIEERVDLGGIDTFIAKFATRCAMKGTRGANSTGVG